MGEEEQAQNRHAGSAPMRRWLWITAVAVLVLDQVTKALIRANIELGLPPRYDVFFHFTHHLNKGVVGGAFRDVVWIPRLAPFLGLLVLVYLFRQLDARSLWQNLAFGLITGGAFGNIVDRLWQDWGVTDFLQFHFMFLPEWVPWRYYPAFNIADSGVVVGLVLLIITWRGEGRPDVARTA